MLGVFIDTLVVSTATGLALLVTGRVAVRTRLHGADRARLLGRPRRRRRPAGARLLVLFGLSTLITWSFYGEQSATYLFGPRARPIYRVFYCSAIAGGAIAGPRLTWAWADILNGMMAIPNLIALLAMAGGLAKLMRESQEDARGENDTHMTPHPPDGCDRYPTWSAPIPTPAPARSWWSRRSSPSSSTGSSPGRAVPGPTLTKTDFDDSLIACTADRRSVVLIGAWLALLETSPRSTWTSSLASSRPSRFSFGFRSASSSRASRSSS